MGCAESEQAPKGPSSHRATRWWLRAVQASSCPSNLLGLADPPTRVVRSARDDSCPHGVPERLPSDAIRGGRDGPPLTLCVPPRSGREGRAVAERVRPADVEGDAPEPTVYEPPSSVSSCLGRCRRGTGVSVLEAVVIGAGPVVACNALGDRDADEVHAGGRQGRRALPRYDAARSTTLT